MDIPREKIEEAILSLESSEGPFYKACQLLKALIEPEKWEPRRHAKYPEKMWRAFNEMTERNKRILQAKTERGFWEGKELKGVYDTFEEAKPKKMRTDKDWLKIGKAYGITPEIGKSWGKFKARIQERIG